MLKPVRRIKIIAVSLMALSLSSCISRLSRPEITGFIVDYDKKPVIGCEVGEAITDKDGQFILPEKRYNAFILTELMVMEAPPLMIVEPIEKSGFEKDAISMFSAHGGGKIKGARYNIDTIFLKRINQQFDVYSLLNNSKWKLSFTKNADTIYLIKDGIQKWCKTDRCSPFYELYEVLTDNYYHTQAKNLPEGMIRRLIDVEFKTEKSAIQIREIRQYKSTFDGPNKETDTLRTFGSWELINNNKIKLNINSMNLISGTFKLSEIDLYQIKLTK